jgi:hypothetical protein
MDPRIRVTAGLRADVFGRAEELALQPRGELSIKLAKQWTARLAAGSYHRPPEFQSEVLTKSLQSEASTQTIAGVQYEPREGIRVQGSLYYTDRTSIITHNPGPHPATTARYVDGRRAAAYRAQSGSGGSAIRTRTWTR